MDRLISEKQVLDAICHDKCGLSPNRCISGITGECVQIKPIKAIPSAEPKTGHWRRISMDKYSEHANYWYRCDRCGKDNLGNTDFCPNCGCRMFEPQESEDKE